MSTPPQFPPAPPRVAPQPPPKKMSGCAIAAIIGAVVGGIGIVVIGILAAIALPAYQQYVLRTQIMQALLEAKALQPQVEEYRIAHEACPDNAALSLADDESIEIGAEPGRRAGMRLGETASGHCAITLTFHDVPGKAEGTTLVLASDDGVWTCTGGTLPAEFRPTSCRTGMSPTP